MQDRCDNQWKASAEGGTVLGQPMLFECMGICVLSPAHECEMRASLVYLLFVKKLLKKQKLIGFVLFQLQYIKLD